MIATLVGYDVIERRRPQSSCCSWRGCIGAARITPAKRATIC